MVESERRQQIIDAATRTFSRHGYHKTSIKAIARAAGIRSPALIYHYFEDKRALFNAVIGQFAPFQGTPLAQPEVADAWLEIPPDVLFPQMLARLLALPDDEDAMRLVRLYLSEAARSPEVAEVVGKFQRDSLTFLRRYLRQQVELKRLKAHDENSVARLLMGSVIAYLLGTTIFPAVAADFPEREAYVASVVDTILHGLAVPAEE